MSQITPRLTIDITEKQSKMLVKYIPWGMRVTIFGLIIDHLEELFEKYGVDMVLGAMVTRDISLKEICRLKLEEKS